MDASSLCVSVTQMKNCAEIRPSAKLKDVSEGQEEVCIPPDCLHGPKSISGHVGAGMDTVYPVGYLGALL